MTLHVTFLLFLIMTLGESCKKLVDVDPPVTSLTSNNVFLTDATAIAAVTAIYQNLSAGSGLSGTMASSLTLCTGLASDEFSLYSGVTDVQMISFYKNSLTSIANNGAQFWTGGFSNIYNCNLAIAGLNSSSTLTPAIKNQLLGEVRFMRAYYYFYLLNLYGDLPLALTPDYKMNNVLARSPKTQVYQQIIADLQDAQQQLSKNYLGSTLLQTTTEKVRPTYWAASALLARVYLYYGNLTGDASNYVNAETQATNVISNNNFALSPLAGSGSIFMKNSAEAIWQLQNTASNYDTPDAAAFVITTNPNSPPNVGALISNSLLNSFESNDQRKINWVGVYTDVSVTPNVKYYYPFKYKVTTGVQTEYETVFRLAEVYLIRAEAEAQENKLPAAIIDLNMIRSRAGLPPTTGTTQAALLSAILHERQIELFSEWGHRWFDLKRTGNVDAVMGTGGACAAKGGTWNTAQQWYPILPSDIQNNPNLKQNPGY